MPKIWARLKLDDDKLPTALTVSTLLNPLLDWRQIVGSGLITQDQYTASRKLIVSMMHDNIDRCTVDMVDESSSEHDSSDDDIIDPTENASYTQANTKFTIFDKLKRNKCIPTLAKSDNGSLTGECGSKAKELWVAPVVSKGKDRFSGKSLANHIDDGDHMQLLKFFANHQKYFPTLWILVQKEASCHVVENMDVDTKWLTQKYLRRCKKNKWKKADDDDALKCFSCERILDAEQLGLTMPTALTMADISLNYSFLGCLHFK
ncbi:hypothetical protein ACHAW6_008166 [Cyclotella cf. meneghiniana]